MFNFDITDVRTIQLACGCIWYFAFFKNGRILRYHTAVCPDLVALPMHTDEAWMRATCSRAEG